jgi:hypothetical protein
MIKALLIDVHREWIAWTAAALLPADLHQRWIRRWRNFWDNSPSPPPPERPDDG